MRTENGTEMMVPIREEVVVSSPRVGSASSVAWIYLVAEFLIGAAFSGFLAFLGLVKSVLPQPPRDLTGDVVLVTGATSTLGKRLAEEFARSGCTVVCVDSEVNAVRETARELCSRYPRVEGIAPDHRKQDAVAEFKARAHGYACDLWDRAAIRGIAKRVKDEVGSVDVLVTCAGHSCQDIFDTVNTTLMSHYWTVLAFLPSMLRLRRAHIVGVTPTASTEDAYAGSRAAIVGLMESLGQEFGSRNSHLNFITVAPKADPRLLRQSEKQVAKEVVQAVRRNQCNLNANWCSTVLYRISCAIHFGITTMTRWLYTQGCEYPY